MRIILQCATGGAPAVVGKIHSTIERSNFCTCCYALCDSQVAFGCPVSQVQNCIRRLLS